MNIIEAFEAVKQGKNIRHPNWVCDVGKVNILNGKLVSEYSKRPITITLSEENLTGWELVEEDLKK